MTVVHLDGFAPYTGKEVLQFSPNYTVYALPSDTLCLYSEDRKFLLNGKLYCAIADAIRRDGKSLAELVRELEQDFPPEQVREALKRLIDRHHIVVKSGFFSSTVAAYWTSLGLPLEIAEKNLQECRIRVQAIGVQGETELSAALAELGVRTAKRSADLTVTLVSDYLDEQLAELNRRHLSNGTRGFPFSLRAFFHWLDRSSAPAKAPAGSALRTACNATERSGRCSAGTRPAA